jgi:hypothetical protein
MKIYSKTWDNFDMRTVLAAYSMVSRGKVMTLFYSMFQPLIVEVKLMKNNAYKCLPFRYGTLPLK